MNDLVAYGRDLMAEVRRVPSLVAVVVAALLFALSCSSEIVADARGVLVNEAHEVWAAAQSNTGGQDLRKLRLGIGDLSLDDLELE